MRALFFQPLASAERTIAGTLPAVPHALVGLATAAVFGAAACMTGLLMAALAMFVLWLPLTVLALNAGAPLPEGETPEITPAAKRVLFVLWTATAWTVAAIVR